MRIKWLLLVGLVLSALGNFSSAEAQDFPTLKGDTARSGRNAAPGTNGPGRAFLKWWRPNGADISASAIDIDNLDLLKISTLGVWNAPTDPSQWAEAPYIPDRYALLAPNVNPPYRYAFSTPSTSNSLPEQALLNSERREFSWNFTAADLGVTARNYALYVYIPIGPTITPSLTAVYPQRYYVYEIFYGTGQRDVEVIDSYQSGFGWVRLGGGGGVTSRLYAYDGTSQVTVRLKNTITRDANEALTELYIPGVTPVVYADAALAVPEFGSYTASPIVGDADASATTDLRTVSALNRVELDGTSENQTIIKGVVSSMRHAGLPIPNNTAWTFTPAEEGELSIYHDNNSAGVVAGAGWTPQNAPAGFRGINYFSAPITDQGPLSTHVEYSPTLTDDSYEVWAWVPGSSGTLLLGTQVTYEIIENGVTLTFVINQDAASGWVRIGNRRFAHNATNGNPLRVRVTNLGVAADLGRVSYADTIRYVGGNDLSITSTPVQVTARVNIPSLGGLVDRTVVIVCAENGRIYCLDAIGNADGTTNVYWTYPSTADADNPTWTDPNAAAGEDGGAAIMPSGFRTSSALVERIGGEDLLYITATNGRVYCIEMAGRGDMDIALRKPGTTSRRWTFPNDYPALAQGTTLGPSYGSVAFADTGAGPTIYVPASEGRIYALDAVGNANRTTNVRWAFPEQDQPTLGSCEMTPAVEFDSVFVGFRRDSGNVGRFYALDTADGSIKWQINTIAGSTAGSFVGSPTVIPASELGGGQPATVVVPNDNLYIAAFDAFTGAELWATNELSAPVLGSLTYTPMTVYNNAGATQTFPCVVAPTTDGRISALFAETAQVNLNGDRLAWFYVTEATVPMETSVAVGRTFMYAADANGYLYAFNDAPGDVYGGIYPPPGQQGVPPNDPNAAAYRGAKIKFITKAMHDRMRLDEADGNFPEYLEAIDPAAAVNRNAFEWGETIYALVYDYPAQFNNDTSLRRAIVDYRFASEGVAIRNLQITSKRFANVGSGNPPTHAASGMLLDGAAVLSFSIQGNGANALPPGPGFISFGLQVQFNNGQGLQSVALDPATSRIQFFVANPLAIAVKFDNAGNPLANYRIAYTTDPTDPEAQTNGSPDIPTTAKVENLLLSSAGELGHGGGGRSIFAVYDRSLMTLLRGPGRGLDIVRIVRSDLAWQNGTAAIYKQLNPVAYPGFEDLPTRFPNTSADYPDIKRENFQIIKDKFGVAENPLFQAISLNAPTVPNLNNPIVRTIETTRMDFEVNIPRFQPANRTLRPTSDPGGTREAAGYYGNLIVYVDGTGNNQFDRRGRAEAFRTMNLGASVLPDEKITVGKTELDLGSLAQGTGYSPIAPWLAASPYSPWGGAYQNLFKTFQAYNEGNINLLNVRVAKATDTGGAPASWGLFAPENTPGTWIDTMFNLWSDIDQKFALNNLAGQNRVMIQKARVGDRNAPELLTNPIRRANAQLGVTQSTLLASPAPASPRLSVTIPIGTPGGTYVTDIRIIEDDSNNESLTFSGTNPVETYSDPTIRLRFNVREARVTNGISANTAPMMHSVLSGGETFLHRNAQPAAMRDINGQLVLAFASTSPNWNDPQPTAASVNDQWRIFVGSLNGEVPSSSPVGQNPLRDLLAWGSSGGRWYGQALGPLPTQLPSDPLLFGPTVVAGSAKFGSPAFSQFGGYHPYLGSNHGPLMAYIGEARLQSPSGRSLQSKIFLTQLNVDAAGGVSEVGAPVAVDDNLEMMKSHPTVLQGGNSGSVIFTGTVAGQSRLYHAYFNGTTMSNSQPLNVGMGFENVGSASIVGRTYRGAAIPGTGIGSGTPIADLVFTGKLKGRTNRELFMGRLRTTINGQIINVQGSRSPVIALSQISGESLSPEENGVYRSRGVAWLFDATIGLEQTVGTGTPVNLLKGNKQSDAETGIITYDSTLGGKIYIDTTQGTVRFAGATPNRRAVVRLTYTPRFVRIGAVGTANYQVPAVSFDGKFVNELSYLYGGNGAPVTGNAQLSEDRFMITVGRSANGTGETSRPYMMSLRFGAQLLDPDTGLPARLQTDANGAPINLQFANDLGPYRVDAPNGRIYFSSLAEGSSIQIRSITVADENNQNPRTFNYSAPFPSVSIRLISEFAESPIAIEGAVNESQMTSFVDLFDNPSDLNQRRGSLLWLFWTSTRGGNPDIYMHSVAPHMTPRNRRTIGSP